MLWIAFLICAFLAIGLRTDGSGHPHRTLLVLITLALGYAFFGLAK